MNPYYQFAMLDGYNYAASAIIPKFIAPTKGEYIPALYTEPEPTSAIVPVKPSSNTGDATINTKPATTINIFNPDGQTSSTSLSDEVTVDGDTGESSSTATQGGGSGGGGGGGGGASKPKQKSLAKKKSMLPLIVLGAGIAILIFKPFKFLK
tara:strand:- start:177 stop:632 length:456 start_codon:yes stop_codon:yes gene_type:complete